MTAFLDWVLSDAGPARVVIAGDFLDFLVPAGASEELSYFDPAGARSRAASIVEHHEEVFDALARIAASPDHELWIASGNHDPELLFLDVRDVIERRLRSSSRAATPRWSVDGEAIRFRIGDSSVLIAHGDAFDDWNRVDRGALRRAANRISYGFSRESEWEYKPPAGTRIVIDHLLRLRKKYPWVDVLKPEREAVFPIVHQFLDVGEHWKYRDLIGTLIKGATESWLEEAIRRSAPQTLIRGGGERSLRQKILQWLRWEDNGGAPNDADLITKLREVSESGSYFDISIPDESAELLPHFFERGTDLLITGHTHAAKAHLVGDRSLYLNSGTWGRLLQLPASDVSDEIWLAFLAQLRKGEDLGESRPTFAWIRRRDPRIEASLVSWHEGVPTCCAAFERPTGERRWARR
jgi:UDP-2,3-diacylglucosamine pyrophosphatase LpxH